MIRQSLLIPALLTSTAVRAIAGTPSGAEEHYAPNAALKYWQAFASFPELDEQEDEWATEWHDAPLDAAAAIVEKGEYALRYLHRGAAIPRCDWGVDLVEDGLEARIPYCAKGRQLARLALLRGRCRFEQGDGPGGVDDALATIKLARDLSSDGLLISWLVRASIEDSLCRVRRPMAIGLLAAYLPTLDADTLRALDAGLDALPPAAPLARAIRGEQAIMLGSVRDLVASMADDDDLAAALGRTNLLKNSGRDPAAVVAAHGGTVEGLLEAVDRAGEFWGRTAEWITLPRADALAAAAAMRLEVEAAGPLVAELVPDLTWIIHNTARLEVRHAALHVAIDVLLDGPDAVQQTRDPAGDGPFIYQPLAGGFALVSALPNDETASECQGRDACVTLTVGQKPD